MTLHHPRCSEFGFYFIAVILRKLWGITYALFMGLGPGTKTKIPEGGLMRRARYWADV